MQHLLSSSRTECWRIPTNIWSTSGAKPWPASYGSFERIAPAFRREAPHGLTALTQQAFVHFEDNVWLSKCIIYIYMYIILIYIYILYCYIILYHTILYCIIMCYIDLYSYLWELRPWSSSLPLNLQANFHAFDRRPNLGPRLFATAGNLFYLRCQARWLRFNHNDAHDVVT